MKASFKQGRDYYFDPDGLMVLTDHFLLERGFCCGSTCRHCPYEYLAVPEPRKSELIKKRQDERQKKL